MSSIPLVAAQDRELGNWLYGVVNGKPTKPGSFLQSIGEAAVRADSENYALLRPVLLALRVKYPQYSYEG